MTTLDTGKCPEPAHAADDAARRLAAARQPGGYAEIQAEALEVLMRLATLPEHASDALVLLHELQVQQVELQMQLDELRRTQSR